MLLGMMPWFAATVVSAAMAAEWRGSDAFQAWLTMAVQLGFVVGTLTSAILLLADRWSPRILAGGSALIAGLATALLTVPHMGAPGGLALRGVTGAALAGVYPPGMKIAAGWWRERRGTAIGVLVGALTLGSAAPNLVRVAVPPAAWRARRPPSPDSSSCSRCERDRSRQRASRSMFTRSDVWSATGA